MKVNICGVPHKIVECEDTFNVDVHFGQIDYAADEQLVQALGNAIYQGFEIKAESKDKE